MSNHIYVRHMSAQPPVRTAEYEAQPIEEEYNIVIAGDHIEPFKLMVQKALNCWPDAHPALKELGDMLMHGKILQDYWHTRTDVKKIQGQ